MNVGTGIDITIRESAEIVATANGYKGEIAWDLNKPDGTPKKQLDVNRLAALGWHPAIPLADGITRTVKIFREQKHCQEARQ